MAQMCEMKLLGKTGSAFTNRVRFVLKLKSIDYEYIEEDLDNKTELFLKASPVFRNVPVLFHGDGPPMIESLAIMEYLDEIKPDTHPILPKNPSDRVQCRILAYTFDTVYYPKMREFMLTRDEEKREEMKGPIIEGIGRLEEAFVQVSKGKAFWNGDDIGYLDIVFGVFLGWFKLFGKVFGFDVIDETRNPRLAQWGKSMWSHEVARSIIPDHEIHAKFLQFLHNRMPPMSRPVVDLSY